MVTLAALILLGLILSGCATTYQPPSSNEPTATINFNANTNYSETHIVEVYKDAINCKNPTVLPSTYKFPFTHNAKTILAPANKLFTFYYFYGDKTDPSENTCDFVYSFVPQKNKYYNVALSTDYDICRLTISEIQPNAAQPGEFKIVKPVNFTERKFHRIGSNSLGVSAICDDINTFTNSTVQ